MYQLVKVRFYGEIDSKLLMPMKVCGQWLYGSRFNNET